MILIQLKKNSFFFIFTMLLSLNINSQNATVTISEDGRIPQLLQLKKEMEKDNKLAIGYTIQLYYGEHKKANEVIRKYRNSFSLWPASIEYETPNYKVWVGNFPTRLEADQARLKITKKFPSAFILKPDRG